MACDDAQQAKLEVTQVQGTGTMSAQFFRGFFRNEVSTGYAKLEALGLGYTTHRKCVSLLYALPSFCLLSSVHTFQIGYVSQIQYHENKTIFVIAMMIIQKVINTFYISCP